MITGAGRGLGRAFVQEAVNKGDGVIAAVRKIPQDDALFQHENIFPVIMDVTRPDEIKAAVKSGTEHFGRMAAGQGLSDCGDDELIWAADTEESVCDSAVLSSYTHID